MLFSGSMVKIVMDVLLNRGCGHHIHHSWGRRKQGKLVRRPRPGLT
jgi:hypothetical protein